MSGADHHEEIGAIVDIHMHKMTNPAVMFDDIPGFPKGNRVLANILTSVPRINIALGKPVHGLTGEGGAEAVDRHGGTLTALPP